MRKRALHLSGFVCLVVVFMCNLFWARSITYRTCKLCAVREKVLTWYCPSWEPPHRAWVTLGTKTKDLASAASLFLQEASLIPVEHTKHDWWNDRVIVKTLPLAPRVGINPADPGRYIPFDSQGNEMILLEFLRIRAENNPEFIPAFLDFMSAPTAKWVAEWRRENQILYYEYYYDRTHK